MSAAAATNPIYLENGDKGGGGGGQRLCGKEEGISGRCYVLQRSCSDDNVSQSVPRPQVEKVEFRLEQCLVGKHAENECSVGIVRGGGVKVTVVIVLNLLPEVLRH